MNQAGDSIGWTFSVADRAIDHLQGGQVVNQSYVVPVNDGKGGIAQQTVTVSITGASDMNMNRSFEQGFSGWETIGTVSRTSASKTNGSYSARLESTGVSSTQVSAFVGTSVSGTNGSAIKTENAVHLDVGETFSFDYRFDAGDYLPYNDFSFLLSMRPTNL